MKERGNTVGFRERSQFLTQGDRVKADIVGGIKSQLRRQEPLQKTGVQLSPTLTSSTASMGHRAAMSSEAWINSRSARSNEPRLCMR